MARAIRRANYFFFLPFFLAFFFAMGYSFKGWRDDHARTFQIERASDSSTGASSGALNSESRKLQKKKNRTQRLALN